MSFISEKKYMAKPHYNFLLLLCLLDVGGCAAQQNCNLEYQLASIDTLDTNHINIFYFVRNFDYSNACYKGLTEHIQDESNNATNEEKFIINITYLNYDDQLYKLVLDDNFIYFGSAEFNSFIVAKYGFAKSTKYNSIVLWKYGEIIEVVR